MKLKHLLFLTLLLPSLAFGWGAGGYYPGGIPTGGGGGGGGSGDVTGPASSVDNSVPVYDGTTGKIIKDLNVLRLVPTGFQRWDLDGDSGLHIFDTVAGEPIVEISADDQKDVVWFVDIDSDGNAQWRVEDYNEGTTIFGYERDDESTPAATTQVGSPDKLMLVFDDSGNGDGDYRVCRGIGSPIQQYDPTTNTHYIYYNVGGTGGNFIARDVAAGIDRIVTGGGQIGVQLNPGSNGIARIVQGSIQVSDSFGQCSAFPGNADYYTLCVDGVGGPLSVKKGTSVTPVSLEEGGGGSPNDADFVEIDVEGGGAGNVTVATLDWTDDIGFQGTAMLVAEIIAGEDGTGQDQSGMYTLKARVIGATGGVTPTIQGLTGSVYDDHDGPGGEGCQFVVSSDEVDIDCNGFNNYKGWLRWKAVTNGPN